MDFVVAAGASGVLVLGSSGECVGLRRDQRTQVANHAIRDAGDAVHVMVGVPSGGTADAASDAAQFAALGADSLLVSAPSGLQLSQAELDGHFRVVSAAAAGTPVVGYEVPSRVGVSLGVALIQRLAADRVLAAVKDSSGDMPKARVLADATQDIDGLIRYTGCEQCIDAALLGGFQGAIPGLANVFADFHVELARRAANGDWAGAARVQSCVVSLMDLYFPSRPLPDASFSAQFFVIVKEALLQLGVIACGASTTPLTQADDELRRHVAQMLERGKRLRAEL
jgi:4-hydroxy-tetrahydrodipicolinate synthase